MINLFKNIAAKLGWWKTNGLKLATTNINSVAKESFDFWTSVGASSVQAYALLGNEDGETSFVFKAVGDKGLAHGIFQWHQDRIDSIKNGCGIDLLNCSHLDMLKGAYWEMNHGIGYRHVWENLLKTTTIKDAITVLVQQYEHSGSQNRDIVRRTSLAEGWQSVFPVTNTSTPAAAASDSIADAVDNTLTNS